MKKIAIAAAALLATTAMPAWAAPIVYTLSGQFSGTLAGNAFTDYQATFTGIGDTATRTNMLDANFVTLASLTAQGSDGNIFVLTDAYQIFAAPSPFGTAGFKTVAGEDKFAFRGAALNTFDNNSSLAPSPVSQYFSAAFQTNQGLANITSSTGLTFSVQAATPGAVPEPATWGMMLLGFGMIGFGMRRRKSKVTTNVSFA